MNNADNYIFIALRYEGTDTAKEALKEIISLRKEGSIQYKDAVAAYKNKKGLRRYIIRITNYTITRQN